MTSENTKTVLFEVSWEVCNKVGGIYSVVSSKALHAVDNYGEDFFLLGPDMKNNADFEETDEPCWQAIRPALALRDLKCRLGRWKIPGNPKVILVDFSKRYNSNQLLYELWNNYGVDSLSGGWEYIEPVMFSYACGEIIAAVHESYAVPQDAKSIAQFHEWMCGAGLLAVKTLAPSIGTVFTTHATMLGRALAGSGVDIYKYMRQINPASEAATHNIIAKCSMESTAAREADCFTTVSDITGEEATSFLGRTPNVITTNGLDMRVVPDYTKDRTKPKEFRKRLLKNIAPMLGEEMDENTRIFVISGRYEFKNKGIDIFIEALARTAEVLRKSPNRVLVLFLVMGGHGGVYEEIAQGHRKHTRDGHPFISPFRVWNSNADPIVAACRRLGLNNEDGDSLRLLFVPAMLNGDDGFINMPYEDVLAACDLGVFPSWYEPWGYTPHESAAYAVPTVTSDLAGFGIWAQNTMTADPSKSGVSIIPRHHEVLDTVINSLHKALHEYSFCSQEDLDKRRVAVRKLVQMSSWENFFNNYITAYKIALERAEKRDTHREHLQRQERLIQVLSPTSSTIPHLRPVTAVSEIPEPITRLHELARNMWWATNLRARQLFAGMSPALWESTKHSPLRILEEIDPKRMQDLVNNPEFMEAYNHVMQKFDNYMAKKCVDVNKSLRVDKPVAYFSTEYGLHESLPIYSGGLGVLSGDHLKSASDLQLPLVAVGLLYRNGYFRQSIDNQGRQIPLYPINNFAHLPVSCITDKTDGKPILVDIDMPGRTLYAQVWKVQVGRIPLYLMDTDVAANTEEDRRITARLYEADRNLRIQQEILLGMGGVRLLRKLNITPSVYHMNEGHSAFMVIERIRAYMHEQQLAFQEAFERVRSNTVFTTHTPVDAGNERFSLDLMERYFTQYAESMGLAWKDFLRLGRIEGPERGGSFEMTVLALKTASRANGVSLIHGIVSQHMWRDLWKGVPIPEIPIGHVTNGVHVPSYVGDPIKLLLDQHLGKPWIEAEPNDPIWEKIDKIPEDEYWTAKMHQKEPLLDALRISIPTFMRKYGIPAHKEQSLRAHIKPNALIVGFARRFAPYKRATLLFADPDRLERLLNNPEKPMIIVFAGKAHPADQAGIELIQQVIQYAQEDRFIGRIFFIEDYSLAVSRLMAQGCDVWLNTPRRPHEASGTSGQKVPVNGGINLSVSDGWWCEGYNRENGWTIGPVVEKAMPNNDQNDYADAEDLYSLFEKSVVPLYYEAGAGSLPSRWIKVSKNSMKSLTSMYSSDRMLRDYISGFYAPAALRNTETHSNNRKIARHIAQWKQNLPVRFGSLSIKEIVITGVENESIACGHPVSVKVSVVQGQMQKEEILTQFVFGHINDNGDYTEKPQVINLELKKEGEELIYEGEYIATHNGRYAYGIRVMPVTEGLESPLESGFVLWG